MLKGLIRVRSFGTTWFVSTWCVLDSSLALWEAAFRLASQMSGEYTGPELG